MKYTPALHYFLERLNEKLGTDPSRFPHHVIVDAGNKIGFAFVNNTEWRVVIVYEDLSLEEMTIMAHAVRKEIEQYEIDNPNLFSPIPAPIAAEQIEFEPGSSIAIIRDVRDSYKQQVAMNPEDFTMEVIDVEDTQAGN